MATITINLQADGNSYGLVIHEPGFGNLKARVTSAHALGLAVEHYYGGHHQDKIGACPFCCDKKGL